ncbi:MAG TPA: F0F1 ATP synthase subunit B [Bacteroidales bacterium]|nr:F0F1 ATP synthase subunit B [Bacteroidales bacterium]HXK81199.1 F0F1 ATP synthase subunit B [Bacteroidales bacterium]
MDLVTPNVGLIFWTGILFVLLLLILWKFAWKPILGTINKRNQSIEDALNAADKARQDMQKLQADNKKIIAEAATERDRMLKEAREFGDDIIKKAKEDAKLEIIKLKENAQMEISAQKAGAINEIKNQVAVLSVDIAEKILRRSLSTEEKHDDLVNDMLKDIKLN